MKNLHISRLLEIRVLLCFRIMDVLANHYSRTEFLIIFFCFYSCSFFKNELRGLGDFGKFGEIYNSTGKLICGHALLLYNSTRNKQIL